ncbi:protein of unknown function [Paraburkholderia kururiensis]
MIRARMGAVPQGYVGAEAFK